MSVARLFVLVLCLSIPATAQTRTLAVYLAPAQGLHSLSSHSLEQELQRLLAPAGVEIVWRTLEKENGKRLEDGPLVVGTFKGICAVDSLQSIGGPFPSKVLGETSVSNEHILPYFGVDCPRLIKMLAPSLERLSVPMRESIFGRAAARVIAHELYHILAQTSEHDHAGIAKRALSLEDLTASSFDLSASSIQKISNYWPDPPSAVPAELAALSPGVFE